MTAEQSPLTGFPASQQPETTGQSAEQRLIDAISACVDDPLAFVRLVFDWGQGALQKWDGPDQWQADVLQAIGTGSVSLDEAARYAISSGHGVGKSALVSWIILWAMSTRPHLAGVCTANTKAQLEKKTWRELSIWHKRAINAHWFKWSATKFFHKDHPETWFVAATPWSKDNSEAFAGLHGDHVLVVFDEASAIDDRIWDVSEGAMTTEGALWCVFGNPTRNSGRFHACFHKYRHRWTGFTIDARQARMANNAQIKHWQDDFGEESDFFRVRVRGLFPMAGTLQFISHSLPAEAVQRQQTADPAAPRVLGVDVARFGDDRSVILTRKGRVIEEISTFQGLDTVAFAGRIAEWAHECRPKVIFIDGVGVGGGVVDQLKAMHLPVEEVNVGQRARDPARFVNKRAELWSLMRDWLETASLPDNSDLFDDLVGPDYGFDLQGRLQLEKKDDMKKRGLASPDLADALALTFANPMKTGLDGFDMTTGADIAPMEDMI